MSCISFFKSSMVWKTLFVSRWLSIVFPCTVLNCNSSQWELVRLQTFFKISSIFYRRKTSYGFGTTWMRVNDDNFVFGANYPFKEMKTVSLFTDLHVVPHLYEFLFSAEHTHNKSIKQLAMKRWSSKPFGTHWLPQYFHEVNRNWKCLRNVLQNICSRVPQKRINHTGLEHYESE